MRSRQIIGWFVVTILVMALPRLSAASEVPMSKPALAWAHRAVIGFHGGRSAPTGDFNGYYNAGFGGGITIGYSVRDNFLVSIGGAFHRVGPYREDRKATVLPFTVNGDYGFSLSNAKLLFGLGLGLYRVNERGLGAYVPKTTESAFGGNGGIEMLIPAGRRVAIGPSFRVHAANTKKLYSNPVFFTAELGVRFGV